ncbi:MAG: helix-turn-helix domain-containing protein [Phycisphaerales bacterium]
MTIGSRLKHDQETDDVGRMEDSWREGFATRLKLAMGDHSIADFARLIGWHPETVRRYLTGETRPPAVFLAKLCDQLPLSPDWLLLGRGPMLRLDRDQGVLDSASLDEILIRLKEFIESPRKPTGGKKSPFENGTIG